MANHACLGARELECVTERFVCQKLSLLWQTLWQPAGFGKPALTIAREALLSVSTACVPRLSVLTRGMRHAPRATRHKGAWGRGTSHGAKLWSRWQSTSCVVDPQRASVSACAVARNARVPGQRVAAYIAAAAPRCRVHECRSAAAQQPRCPVCIIVHAEGPPPEAVPARGRRSGGGLPGRSRPFARIPAQVRAAHIQAATLAPSGRASYRRSCAEPCLPGRRHGVQDAQSGRGPSQGWWRPCAQRRAPDGGRRTCARPALSFRDPGSPACTPGLPAHYRDL